MGSKTSMLKNIAIGSVLISMVIFIYLNVFIIFVISFGISIDVFGFVDPIHYASLADMKKAIISSLYPVLPVYVLINFLLYFILMAVYNLAKENILFNKRKKASED